MPTDASGKPSPKVGGSRYVRSAATSMNQLLPAGCTATIFVCKRPSRSSTSTLNPGVTGGRTVFLFRLRLRVACPELVEGLSTNRILVCYVFSPFVLSVAAPAAKSKDAASPHSFAVDVE